MVGAGGNLRTLTPVFLRYYHLVVESSPQAPGLRNLRELRTISEFLDHIIDGNVTAAADILVQRFKAMVLAASEGSWNMAQHLELLPPSRAEAAADMEKEIATREEMKHQKLKAALENGRTGGKDKRQADSG